MLDKLSVNEWSHFTDGDYFCRLLKGGADVLLIGNARSGKKTLIHCLKLDDDISIECSILNTPSGVQSEFFRQLSQQVTIAGLTHNIRSFEAAFRLLDSSDKQNKVHYVIFRNAEKFYQANAPGFKDFFRNYISFAGEMRHKCGIFLQAIILSRTDLPLSFPRCYLPYPDSTTLKRFLTEKVDQICKSKYNKSANISANLRQFVLQCSGFAIQFRDFESFEIIARKLLYMLKKSYENVRNGNYEIKDQFYFVNCRSVFYQTPKMIYRRKKDLAIIAETRSTNMSLDESTHRAQLEFYDRQAETAKTLPLVAKFLLLAIQICKIYTPASDERLFGNIKTSSKSRHKQKLAGYRQPRQNVKVWRVCNVADMIANSVQEKGRLEETREYHSNEFFLCFDFLERVGFIACTRKSPSDCSYSLLCDVKLIEKIKYDLGFEEDIKLHTGD